MWALICDVEDDELRVVTEGTARGEYLNGEKYSGTWKLQATNADRDLLLTMCRLTGGREEELDYAVCFLRS